jgi:tetratricopeptide (TPR) repeat protein
MNSAQIQITYKSANHLLSNGQLKNALLKIQNLVNELQVGEYNDRLEEIQQNYRFLLQYFIAGTEDPQRKSVYNKLIAKIFVLNSELREELQIRNSTNFEYTQKRYYPHTKHHGSCIELFNAFKYFHKQSAFFNGSEGNHSIELNRLRSNYELLFSELFGLFWLTTFYKTEEKNLFNQILDNNYKGWIEKTILISAITLNLWRMFDEAKLMLLFDACQSENQQVKQRALVGLCFILAKYNRFLQNFPQIRNRLVLLTDDQHILENFQNIIIQIIATAETDKISKKMQEEILPEMMKISPMLKDKMDSESLINTDEWNEENPEWQELLNKSGISDKLKELSELQLEGADVYMSTFSLLKNFPFFSVFSNWFLPFDPHNSAIDELFQTDDKTLISAFVDNNIMCNSDKYSFCLSILQMPESQRGMLKKSFKMEAEQLDELTKEDIILTPELISKNISKQYIQDLFRFFKLNPQHADFKDIFSLSLTLHHSFLFNILATNSDIKSKTAEYYFLKNHYNQALDLFEELKLENTLSTPLFQKIGYMYQQTSQFQKAIDAYSKADFLQPDDLWTVRKLALCYRLSGNFEKALEFYQHANFLKPNQSNILMQIGHCFVELNKFKDALNIFFKIDTLDEENIKVWRAISWCSFVTGNIQQSDYYLNKLIENEPNAYDFLNAGHVAFCQRKVNQAIDYYRKSLSILNNNVEIFHESFNEDKKYLIKNGVDAEDIPLILDAMLM